MARLFGKPTNGMFAGGDFAEGNLSDAWHYHFSSSLTYLNTPGGGNMIHRGVQPDEQIWLTRDGVAKGEDDVVKRALEWINALSYAHAVALSKDTARSAIDSIRLTAKVRNPNKHTLVLSATVANANGQKVDSLILSPVSGDSLWAAFIRVPGANGSYSVEVRTQDVTAGSYRLLPSVVSFTVVLTNVEQIAGPLPNCYALEQNYPNPFNPATTINFQFPVRAHIFLKVYDLMGREVATLVNEVKQPGKYGARFDGSGLASGVYYYRFQAGTYVQTRKLVIVR
jgi:hypothetical protein